MLSSMWSIPGLAGAPSSLLRLISTSQALRMPDVVVPPMGESIKEGTIAAVLKQVGAPVREDEVIAQIETDKVTIDVKAPAAGFLHKILIKPSDLVSAGQLVAVVGAEAVAGSAAAAPSAAAPGAAASGAPAVAAASSSGRAHSIKFPPRMTADGVRISSLSDGEYDKAIAAATAASSASAPAAAAPAAPAAAAAPAVAKPAAESYPMSAMKAANFGAAKNKNRLTYVTRPDGRGGPPRRELTARELELINLGGAY
ncbi:hypothetical protein HYH02_006862 [Chlamydomonas schloesseri]|uniref:Lipoyl-binding domain-containing protein n=1 Tax=Chlamydomonas schloesseri TaxID=2026947 RepID=A0A835WJ68_9CHLO|nr:hypothetical protein HYH02_006862 [Chlamydomonas schloesseri]|eukprot:KAG2448278.1 hypothetical protein HYH02_006862 [Chlamydomonas schloesseri]